MDEQAIERGAAGNPFQALIDPPSLRPLLAARTIAVRAGQPEQEIEAAKTRERLERRRANARARYQRRKGDPAAQARRRAWAARHKDKLLAAQRAARATPEGREAHRLAQRDYYARNRVEILARAKARREEIRAIVLAAKGGAT